MDHISRIAVFLEVVRQQSFSGAARQLGMTGPAISKQVQALEDQLGVRLLHRTTRQVTLTEEGALYSDRARKALEDLSEAEQQIQDLKDCPTGQLRINAPMSFGTQYLTKPIAEFARQYPNVHMNVTFDDRNVDIVAEGYDVVVRIGALQDSSLIARQIATCPILMCAAPALIQDHGMPASPEDIATWPALISSHQGLNAEWHYQAPNKAKGSVSLKPVFTANTAGQIAEACVAGVGISMLPIFSVEKHLKTGELINLFPDHQTVPERGIYAIFPQNRYLSTKTRLFVDWLTVFGKNLPW